MASGRYVGRAAVALLLGWGLSACASSTDSATSRGRPEKPGENGGAPAFQPGSGTSAGGQGGALAYSPDDFPLTPLEANGYTFDVRLAGPASGELVVLLHGFPETSYEWRQEIGPLVAAGYRVLAPDQRGYSAGARPTDTQAYVVTNLVADVLALADAVGADTFHVVGHDWGSAVAWGVAIAAPARVKTLTAVSVPHPGAFAAVLSDPTSCQYNASAYFDVLVQPHSEEAFLADDAAGLRATYSEFTEDAVTEYLRVLDSQPALSAALSWYRANVENRVVKGAVETHVKMPTLMVWSDADAFLCREGADRTADYADGPYRLEVIEGVDHWVPELAADRLTALLLDQLAR